ncbi:hypothetical protein O0235_00470 [Tepidiforma flava]|uniref:Fe/B12 periplasmic-binding domain-containing protein n=1 Tax=Tepidiforma flava TaxID=3004094 RepID=A0ABY7M6V2_9CHLR|nr:hypothetical protein [Tepidiforma flava]WBL36135.1 hypothetical protein O0235_00470 [Tepidiforma flava]
MWSRTRRPRAGRTHLGAESGRDRHHRRLGKGLEHYRALLDSPAVQALPAVKENRIVVVPAWQAFLPTDRVFLGLEVIAKALHPEAF